MSNRLLTLLALCAMMIGCGGSPSESTAELVATGGQSAAKASTLPGTGGGALEGTGGHSSLSTGSTVQSSTGGQGTGGNAATGGSAPSATGGRAPTTTGGNAATGGSAPAAPLHIGLLLDVISGNMATYCGCRCNSTIDYRVTPECTPGTADSIGSCMSVQVGVSSLGYTPASSVITTQIGFANMNDCMTELAKLRRSSPPADVGFKGCVESSSDQGCAK
jgi:hypothetical protein